jgi:high frequency lysogenization protein
MDKNNHNRTIALAGLFQAVRLVQQVAREGIWDEQALKNSIHSLFTFDADSVEAIFGGLTNLETGLRAVVQQITPPLSQDAMELTKYAIAVIHLERRLHRNKAVQQGIEEGLKEAERQFEYFADINLSVIGRVADVYQNTISGMGPRIMVQGNPDYLQNSDNSARIRSLLFAAIRACVLWRQAGGNRFQLLLGRSAMQKEASRLLESIK